MTNIHQGLDELFSTAHRSRDPADLAVWGTDWTTAYRADPAAVVFPTTIAEVVALVKLANREDLKLVPSGGRTGLSGGAVAGSGEIVVSFDKMNRIVDFSAPDRLVTCQPGLVTAALQAFADEQGLCYPVEFASSGSSQIGGNIATNAGGIRVIRYGLTRDWVAGLRVVTGSGDLIDCNHGLAKNATGYDLRHLFVGSEGTLGFIVEADIRLTTRPEPQRVMVLGVPDFRDILEVLECFRGRLELSAFEFFSELALAKVRAHRALRPPFATPCPFYALVEFDESALPLAESAFEQAMESGWVVDGILSQSEAQAASMWQLREGISESIAPFTPYKNDLAVRISEMPGFLGEVEALVRTSYPDFEVCWYGHIGDGNLHLNILKPDGMSVETFHEHCHRISPSIFALVAERNGSISAEHGVGLLKRDFLEYSRSPAEVEVMRSLKRVFDPHGIMNPGKLLR